MIQANTQQLLIEIGQRVHKKRISKNLSQMVLAKRAGMSRRTIQAIENGESISLLNFITILKFLDSLDSLDALISPTEISPLMLVKTKGKERQRAYTKENSVAEDSLEW